MEFHELMYIAHKEMAILNPSSPEKILRVGELLGLQPGNRIIDFGSGTGEALVQWAEKFGISGTGVDISTPLCEGANEKITKHGLSDRIELVNKPGSEFIPERPGYDVATCIGATFIWDSYRSAIQAMKKVVRPSGKLAIGEVYWLKEGIPQEYLDKSGADIAMFEHELLQITMEEGYDIEYIVRASLDDWDRYNTGRWHNLIRWIHENPVHPDRQEIINHLHVQQEKYLRYEREYLGWAIYILAQNTY